jgi:hypothetical protein
MPEPELAVDTAAFWDSLLAEQQGLPASGIGAGDVARPGADASNAALEGVAAAEVTPPAADRPAVKVNSAEPPAPPVLSESFAPHPHRPRAKVKVNPIPAELDGAAARERPKATPARTMGRPTEADVPELVLETPVEMWFGDARVGVKPGSATYERFRKYADVLFADLKESRGQADNS